jgi:peptidoglycan LD-endopeptidase LytH
MLKMAFMVLGLLRKRQRAAGRWAAVGLGVLAGFASPGAAERLVLAWPTPNRAYLEGAPLEDFVQATASGEVNSGLYGCTRRGGTQFHEGLDLFPIRRDARGEALDDIYAVLPGVVRHVNARAGASSYGRYIVLEHPEVSPAIYTLYSHLAAIDPAVRPGAAVARGQVLGRMGRSAGGYVIPRERAHLHFEMGLRLSDDFQSWYDSRGFGSRNEHGVWNGMNLIGFDPLDFFDRFRAREIDTVDDYLRQVPVAVVARVAVTSTPDFVLRYPSLLRPAAGLVVDLGGWDVAFSVMGVPLSYTPVARADMAGQAPGSVRLVTVDEAAVRACACRHLVRWERGRAEPGRDLLTNGQLIFGLRP